MFERLQKPFLTVETGEAYQPIRLKYDVQQPTELARLLNSLKCIEKTTTDRWNWLWTDETANLHFESIEAFKHTKENPHRLGTLSLKNDALYLSLPSFKRACLAVPFFHQALEKTAIIDQADFINKVFGLSERLPHGFSELFNEDELEEILSQRQHDYSRVQVACENAGNAETAIEILAEYTRAEAEKRLPYAERYSFEKNVTDAEIMFLSFYIFLRGRELVAIRRWFGETGYNLVNAAEETMEDVFGGMNIDILD